MASVCCFQFVHNVFQRWLLSEHQEEVLDFGSTAIWFPTALSNLIFLCMTDSPTMLTSSTSFDVILLENRYHARTSGSSISLMRSAEHFWKASDSSLKVAALFFGLELLGLGECRAGEYECGKTYSRGQLKLQWNSWQQPALRIMTTVIGLTDCSLLTVIPKISYLFTQHFCDEMYLVWVRGKTYCQKSLT